MPPSKDDTNFVKKNDDEPVTKKAKIGDDADADIDGDGQVASSSTCMSDKSSSCSGNGTRSSTPKSSAGSSSSNYDKTKPKQQSSLTSFFSTTTTKSKKIVTSPASNNVKNLKKTNRSASSLSLSSRTSSEQKNSENNDGKEKKNMNNKSKDSACATTADNDAATDNDSAKAIVPKIFPSSSSSSVVYESIHDKFVLVRKPRRKRRSIFNDGNNNDDEASSSPRTSVAAFDLDGTLLRWASDAPGFWPSQLGHYELWSEAVVTKMRRCYDDEERPMMLVVFTNQGGIQGAHNGKKATLIKSILDWLEYIIERPLIVIASTKSLKKYPDRSFHKPTPNMWKKILVPYFGSKKHPFDVSSSFFVGDSADESDPQGGVDKKFADNVGLRFYEPREYFGPSNQEIRQRQIALNQSLGSGGGGNDESKNDDAVTFTAPSTAIELRTALMGGYYPLLQQQSKKEKEGRGAVEPILLLLSGVQGSGKSTFAKIVLRGCENMENDYGPEDGKGDANNGSSSNNSNHNNNHYNNNNNNWVCFSQDTINNGKPGSREKVFEASRKAILDGKSVIIDRMHLNPEQREVSIESVLNNNTTDDDDPKIKATLKSVRVHVVLLNPPKDVIVHRVYTRKNHPGKVEGQRGVQLASSSLNQLVVPSYNKEKGLDLISCVSTEFTSKQLALRYHNAFATTTANKLMKNVTVPMTTLSSSSSSSSLSIPSVTLGTMKIGRRNCTEIVRKMVSDNNGFFRSIDTAPTYNNEDKIGEALAVGKDDDDDVFIIVKVPKRATDSDQVREEFNKTLKNLNRTHVDLLLLHWPSDVIAMNTLKEVWVTMESFVRDGKCKGLGVCNFNENALAKLLRCTMGSSVPPIVNQIERHPLLPQHELIDFCARNNILIQSHTTFGGGSGNNNNNRILNHPTIVKIANEVDCTPAQIIIQWNLQHGVLVVTRCTQEKHGKEIFSVVDGGKCGNSSHSSDDSFSATAAAEEEKKDKKKKIMNRLSPEHMKALDGLGDGTRFIAPPFMYSVADDAIYSWGERMPSHH